MTDKRPGSNGFQYIQPRRKIPKLDVSIVSSSQSSTVAARPPQFAQPQHRNAAPTRQHPPVPTSSNHQAMLPPRAPVRQPPPQQPPPPSSEDMWGDDDDDFIISQAAEKVENCNPQQLINALDQSTSFDDFGLHVRNGVLASASTQMSGVAPPPVVHVIDDDNEDDGDAVLREFAGGGDDVFSEMMDLAHFDGGVNQQLNEYLDNEQNTMARQLRGGGGGGSTSSGSGSGSNKTPTVAVTAADAGSSATAAAAPTTSNKYQQNVENAREIRLKFLNAQLADRQRENEQLQCEVTKLNERCQTKDGEIAMIRYDLQANRKLQADLRQDKLAESERIKSEYGAKMGELERSIAAKHTEMEFMRIEVLNLKSRRLNDTTISHHHQPTKSFTTTTTREPLLSDALFRLHLTHMQPSPRPTRPPLNHLFRHPPPNRAAHAAHRPPNALHDHLVRLQLLAASLHSTSSSNDDADDHPELLAEIRSTLERSFGIMQSECASAAAPIATSATSSASTTSDQLLHTCDEAHTLQTRASLLAASARSSMAQPGDLFAGESLAIGRRIVAVCAAMAQHSWRCCALLFQRPTGGVSLIQHLTRMQQRIGASADWLAHAGLVQATAELLRSLATQYARSASRCRRWDGQLQPLLHATLFCRPSGAALGHIARLLETMSRCHPDLVQRCCQRSSAYALCSDGPRRVHFSAGCCTLQLYAVWLQTEFEPDAAGSASKAGDRLLVELALSALRLMQRGSGEAPPIPLMVRSGVSGGGDLDMCMCYAQLVCACVVLTHRVLGAWIAAPRRFDMRAVCAVAQLAVGFVADHFALRYEGLVLRVGGPAVKQRLAVVVAWLDEYRRQFLFDRAHEQALQVANGLRGVRHMFELLGSDGMGAAVEEEERSGGQGRRVWEGMLKEVRGLRERPEEHDGESEDTDDTEPEY